ncbi:MAG: ATP-binding cassette domain-containing protein [Clostridiales bacterium]|nr:ATP-binding cassette domain-containing protein [Clostridiales bacterium]
MVECENLVKIYKTEDIEVVALQGLDLTIERGELMAIIGNSGSGKSTLLNMLGALDKPSAGKLFVDGKDLLAYNEKQIYEYKRNIVGFVWQNNARNLIPYLSAVENVEVPMILTNSYYRRKRASEILDMVGLSHRKRSKLNQLSGGEQQRVAIAISLANTPKLLLADEPTGAVDSKTASMILDIFRELSRNLGLTIIIVTHDMQISRKVNRVVSIRDGRTSSEFIRRSYKEEIAKVEGLASLSVDEEKEEDSHEEFVVVDRVGRLQVPKDYMDKYKMKAGSRLRFEYKGDDLVLTPITEESEEKEAEE